MKKFTLFICVFQFVLLTTSHAQNWTINGNGNINPDSSFLGTKNNKPIIFKTNNTERMRIIPTGKIGIGVTNPLQKLDVNGNINMSAGSSLFIDNHKIVNVDLATQNIFLGTGAGTASISGTANTSVGNNALYSVTTGSDNTAVGMATLFSNTEGFSNTAIGYNSLLNNTTGFSNTASGFNSLYNNTTGSANIAIGRTALFTNTTGFGNTATGYISLYYNTIGSENTSYGDNSLFKNVSGSNNVAIGAFALNNTTSSWNNTAVGYNAGGANNYGYNNTFIGAETNAANDTYNCTALGNGVYISAPNQVRVGNSSVASIGGWASWSNVSDGRVKKNIKENVPGLSFINKLKPVTYNLDLDAADKILQINVEKNKDGKLPLRTLSQTENDARNAKQKFIYTGFVAQDVEKAAKELNYDFSGVDAAKNDKDLYGLRYAEFVVPLVKAVQELSGENEKVKSKNEELEKRIKILEAMVNVKQAGVAIARRAKIGSLSNASLEQNVPNPFNGTTKINYTLPRQYSFAKIIITDKLGKTIKEINVSSSGSLNINASTFSSGSYQYSLIVDGKLVDTKQMILTK